MRKMYEARIWMKNVSVPIITTVVAYSKDDKIVYSEVRRAFPVKYWDVQVSELPVSLPRFIWNLLQLKTSEKMIKEMKRMEYNERRKMLRRYGIK